MLRKKGAPTVDLVRDPVAPQSQPVRRDVCRESTFLVDADEVAELVVGSADGRPVFLADVAEIRQGVDWPQHLVRHGTVQAGMTDSYPAVTLAVAKQPGTNAVDVANQVIARFEQIRGIVVPDGIQATVTPDKSVARLGAIAVTPAGSVASAGTGPTAP